MTPFLQTNSGNLVSILDPKPETIVYEDIVLVLSRTCRFNGHTDRFYSVAQHSCYCAELANLIAPEDHHLALACLMHDAAEAYVGDIVSPVKQFIPKILDIERKMLSVIFHKFGLQEQTTYTWERVLHIDRRLLFTEVRDLLPRCTYELGIPIEPVAPFTISPSPITLSRVRFNRQFSDLMIACDLDPTPHLASKD